MTKRLNGKWIVDNSVTFAKLESTVSSQVLATKLMAYNRGVTNFTTTASSSDTVSTEVLAAAITDTPVTDFNSAGIYVGTVANITSKGVVFLRQTGTDTGLSDGNGGEVYGKLTESAGVYTLSYFKEDGTAHIFTAPEAIDYYFVAIDTLDDMPSDVFLMSGITGVIDADSSTLLSGHLDGGSNKHDASEIDVETAGAYYAIGDLEAALSSLDDQVAANASSISTNASNISSNDTDISNLQAFDTSLGSVANGAGASLIAIEDSGANYTATDVEAALAEIAGRMSTAEANISSNDTDISNLQAFDTSLSSTDNGSGASLIAIEDAGANYTATDVEAALSEIAGRVSTNESDIATLQANQQIPNSETFTLAAGDITNKYVDLAQIPAVAASVSLVVLGGVEQEYSVDFAIITDGADNKRLTWDSAEATVSTGMEADLIAGDKLLVRYHY